MSARKMIRRVVEEQWVEEAEQPVEHDEPDERLEVEDELDDGPDD